MQEHTFHQPYPQSISIPAATNGTTCPFCGLTGHVLGTVCRRCNVASPSPLSEISISELLKRKARRLKQLKKRPASSDDYIPQTDGVNGLADQEQADELSEYQTDLDALAVDAGDDAGIDDGLLPELGEIETLPWL